MSIMAPAALARRTEGECLLSTLVWRFASPVTCVSTAAVGGGLAEPLWLVNAQVPHGYRRTDLAQHGEQIATALDLSGPGVVMLTAVDVRHRETVTVEDVTVTATVGVSDPVWAADLSVDPTCTATPVAGTINLVVQLPVRLTPAAMVNLVATVTEAKCQALADADVPGTGTPSDAVAVVCPPGAGQLSLFGGPRSATGRPAAIATYRAITAALRSGSAAGATPC
ncbi:MAG TPA: adenosylcobinamide amidohydrolase [Mycobacteriales bacterium]|jgi:adenosylcobinamide amidohydrolase|nr:adenosylcobinamide amidohydrolase [Mycobacteriales bacterium]